MYTEKLKPCPFCGGPAKFRTEPDVDECGSCSSYGWIQVVCEDCGARTNEFFCKLHEHPNTAEKLEAKEAWNRRCGAPTIDPEDLRPTMCWMMERDGYGICSNCNRGDHIDPLAKFCRYCGARTEG